MAWLIVVIPFVVVAISVGRISYALSGRRHRDEITTEQRRRTVGQILARGGATGVSQQPGAPRDPAALTEDDFYR